MSHNGHATQQELQYENQLDEQQERIRILKDRIFFLDSLPWNVTASQSERFNQELYDWRQELRESIKSLEGK
jgi:hypothetical protein|tara:strand:- start:634 stop:849 length:216 start_codon:yes stop_codon:yes gene_type:complete